MMIRVERLRRMNHDATSRAPDDITSTNRAFYDALWTNARLQRPEQFNTWPLVSGFLPGAAARLEIGPGLRPRLPVAGTHFVDISAPALARLNASGGIATEGTLTELPFGDQRFDLVCACDVIEHVPNDRALFREVSRVLRDDGVLICSVPIHARLWTVFDDWVGHARRYDPAELFAVLSSNELQVERSAAYGMQHVSSWWTQRGMWWLNNHRRFAMFWYNWVGMPIAVRLQKRMHLVPGVIDTTGVDELLLVCRRRPRATA
jgi:SAM-dependent methyltransferase